MGKGAGSGGDSPAVQVGDTVHFVLGGAANHGEHRPAVVVGVNDGGRGDLALRVFTHGPADADMYDSGSVFLPSVKFDGGETPAGHTWHPKDDTAGPAEGDEAAYPGRAPRKK